MVTKFAIQYIIQNYRYFLINNFKNAIIVFGRYKSEPSNNDSTHYRCQRKSSKQNGFSEKTIYSVTKEEFYLIH